MKNNKCIRKWIDSDFGDVLIENKFGCEFLRYNKIHNPRYYDKILKIIINLCKNNTQIN